MAPQTPEERRAHLQRIAPLGGRARAARLTPERRRAIARRGFQAMVHRRFGGDRQAALDGLTAKGQWAQDPAPWNGFFRDPGPMPPPADDREEPEGHQS